MLLEHIEKILSEGNIDCTIEKASDVKPEDHLVVFLGLDDQERERLMVITAREQLIDTNPKPIIWHVQYELRLPFDVEDVALNQVASAICFINRESDLPGFELNEIDGHLFYRYVMFARDESLTPQIVLGTIGYIIALLDLNSTMLERIASGQVTFNKILEETLATISEKP